MAENNQRVVVSILDKDYQVACPADERQALLDAASELDGRMRDVRKSGQIVGLERIAVMVALNLCHELQQSGKTQSGLTSDEALQRLSEKLDAALSD